LNSDTYSVDLAEYDNGNITPNGESISLTKTALSENPILLNTVINQGNHKIGYLMYNGFYASYDYQLNAAFGQMQSANITDLVLDLRYNSGGSIRTATRLASMITGQFNGQLFAKEQWNAKAQAYYEDTNPGNLKNNFSNSIGNTTIKSLQLNKIYILTSKSTASASELIINCLKPYINVVQIGDITTGKNVGSITLYDSPTFSKADASGSHYYAMQPIVLKIVNKNGFGDYTAGLAPNYPLVENLGNLNTLGNTSEPLLSTAIGLITANGRMLQQNPLLLERDFEDTKTLSPLRSEMYKEQN
jgi:C-terminal processing protease CtpA/Prc